ncbi:MAG: hypothetical protein IPQ01_11250 [Zoogloea sp.]|nr:hypothetical protein [Zoogloea sp.]
MRLSELVISHYKSLENIELENIQPITVLVGCNGAGKAMSLMYCAFYVTRSAKVWTTQSAHVAALV